MAGMKRLISTILVASVLASSTPAWADPPVDPAAPPTTEVTPTESAPVVSPVQKGQPAPFTGVLFSPEAVAQVVAEKDTNQKELTLAVQHQKDLDGAQLEYEVGQLTSTCKADKSILMARIEGNERQIKVLDEQLKKSSGGLGAGAWIGIGAGIGIATTLLTVFVVTRVTN